MRALVTAIVAVCAAMSAHGQAVSVTGRVGCAACGTTNLPAYRVVFAVNVSNFSFIGYTICDAEGGYSLSVTGGTPALLAAFGGNGRREEGYEVHEHLFEYRTTLVATNRHIDFDIAPAFEVVLVGTNANGIVTNAAYVNLFFTDLQDRCLPCLNSNCENTNLGVTVPGVNLPLGRRVKVFCQWELPLAGRMMACLDNGGEGYGADAQGAAVLNVNLEIARSAIGQLQRDIAAATVPTTDADAALAVATNAFQSNDWDFAAGLAIVAQEELALDHARAGIELWRKGDLVVSVLDAEGNPVPGAVVTATQQERDFLFGAFDSLRDVGTDVYVRAHADGITHNTAGFYWTASEPEDDDYRWDYLSHDVGIVPLHDLGFVMKGHPLIWLNRDLVMPGYLLAMDYAACEAECREHVEAMVTGYCGRVGMWEIINEAHGYPAMGGFTRGQVTTITSNAAALVHSLDTDAVVIVNSSFDYFGTQILGEMNVPDHEPLQTLTVPAYVEDLLAHGVAMDRIGLQFYDGGCCTVLSLAGFGNPFPIHTFDLALVRRIIERMSEFGLPIVLTEQSVPSLMAPECPTQGYWRNPWSESNQADFVEAWYTLGFGSRAVRAITWWNLFNETNAFVVGGSMYRSNGAPKESYQRLTNLIATWTTAGSAVTATSGTAAVRGFGGGYRVDASVAAWSNGTAARVIEQAARTAMVVLADYHTPYVAVSSGVHGSVSPGGRVFTSYGADLALAVRPQPFFEIEDVFVDGSSVAGQLVETGDGSWTYTFHGLTNRPVFTAAFKLGPDTDEDGMADAWELEFFASLTNMGRASDWDRDGFGDLFEFLAGTCPTSDTDYLRVALPPGKGDRPVISWSSASGRLYRLSASSNPLAGQWPPAADPLPATPPWNVFTDSVTAPGRFYRVETE